MTETDIEYLNLTEKIKHTSDNRQGEAHQGAMEGLAKHLQRDPVIFLLNNLLMTVQFFENYDRDMEALRENWFKDISLRPHHKRCFYADSIFRLTGANVKFLPQHGMNKYADFLLHPLRIYVSSDNVDAAYDPSLLGQINNGVRPHYQLKVKIFGQKKEKSGFITLSEFQTLTNDEYKAEISTEKLSTSMEQPFSNESHHRSSTVIYRQKKSNLESSRSFRKLTRTEKFVGFQNKEISQKLLEKRSSLRFGQILIDDTIPSNSFYTFIRQEKRLTPMPIKAFRMNIQLQTSHEIPQQCFQNHDVKNNLKNRRLAVTQQNPEVCFTTEKVLNSAAFKGYFCDLLFKKLSGPLGLDFSAVTESAVQEESIIFVQKGVRNQIIPVIMIHDWRNHLEIRKQRRQERVTSMEWPTKQMQRIINILPCYAVPVGYLNVHKENLDYEKEWKLIFPKAEEFLLLHMMQAHIRCYFFALAIYRTFIEPETNSASFGPQHLLHHLFWTAHKDFLACPEDRQGEVLLNFFESLYRRLKNKYLPDFFITSRNLFANSLIKDLHMAQSIIKRILENPLPYVTRSLRNLHVESEFYPRFNFKKFHTVLTEEEEAPIKTQKKKRKAKKVRFENDEEKEWTKNAIKQIEIEKKIEEQEVLRRLSIESIKTEDFVGMNPDDLRRFQKVVDMFISHFTEMGLQSVEYRCVAQAHAYLYQNQRLIQLLTEKVLDQQDIVHLREKISTLKEKCLHLKKTYILNAPHETKGGKKPPVPKNKPKIIPKGNVGKPEDTIPIQVVETENEIMDTGEYETRL